MGTKRKLAVIILAAGKGTRMGGNDIPKVLIPFRGRPMLAWVLDAVRDAALDARVVIVVGHGADQVQVVLGPSYRYVVQEEQRGTGDAVRTAQGVLEGAVDDILVLYGDHPMLQSATIRALVATHEQSNATLTMATVTVEDFNDWRQPFANFGRIIRDADGTVQRIVEAFAAMPAERTIREVNPAYMCFRASWLWGALATLTNDNAKHEYLLTDLIARAIDAGERVVTVPMHDPREALGVNTRDELVSTEQIIV